MIGLKWELCADVRWDRFCQSAENCLHRLLDAESKLAKRKNFNWSQMSFWKTWGCCAVEVNFVTLWVDSVTEVQIFFSYQLLETILLHDDSKLWHCQWTLSFNFETIILKTQVLSRVLPSWNLKTVAKSEISKFSLSHLFEHPQWAFVIMLMS